MWLVDSIANEVSSVILTRQFMMNVHFRITFYLFFFGNRNRIDLRVLHFKMDFNIDEFQLVWHPYGSDHDK